MTNEQLIQENQTLREMLEKMRAELNRIAEENQQLKMKYQNQFQIQPVYSEVM